MGALLGALGWLSKNGKATRRHYGAWILSPLQHFRREQLTKWARLFGAGLSNGDAGKPRTAGTKPLTIFAFNSFEPREFFRWNLNEARIVAHLISLPRQRGASETSAAVSARDDPNPPRIPTPQRSSAPGAAHETRRA